MMDAKTKVVVGLPPGLEQLLADYATRCRDGGMRESSIALYVKIDRWLLENLAAVGCESAGQIGARNVAAACLALRSNYYLSTVRTFLRTLAAMERTDRDYSGVVPPYKRPQPMPTVYTESEVLQIESAVSRTGSKRNCAMVLLLTRLGIRSGDIARMTFSDLDFEAETVRVLQQKTAVEIKLPMLPEIKAALCDYIDNERPECDNEHVFVSQRPPAGRCMTIMYIGNMVRRAIGKSGVVRGNRHGGPHSFRSSLASSMVNDGISYDAVRKTLGHVDTNAIKSYARLDTSQLRAYALPVPEPTGDFARFLFEKAVL
jgi:integrase